MLVLGVCGCQSEHRREAANAMFLQRVAASAPPPPEDSLPCNLNMVANLPIQEIDGHLVIEAIINGMPAHLVFDTGAEVSLITPAAAKRLAMHLEAEKFDTVQGLGGKRMVSIYRTDSFSLDLFKGSSWYFSVSDIGHVPWTNVDGLLGADFMARFDIDLDLPGKRIRLFYPHHDCSHPSAFLHGPLYQVDLDNPLSRHTAYDAKEITRILQGVLYPSPSIQVEIGNLILRARIDTGAPDNFMLRPGLRKLGIKPSEIAAHHSFDMPGIGPDKSAAAGALIKQLAIGDFEIGNVPMALIDEDPLGRSGTDLVLGLRLIRRIHMWISHTSGTLIMQFPPTPSPEFAPPPETGAPAQKGS